MRYFQELQASLRLAVPLTIALLAQIGISLIDSIMMGYLGPQALAAGALAIGVYMLVLVFCIGLVSAVGVCVAQAKGAQNYQAISYYLQQGVYFSLLISIPMMLLLWRAAPLLLLLQQNSDVVQLTSLFLHGLIWGYPSVLLFFLLREFVSNFNKPMIIVIVSLSALPLNFVLDYGFVFGAFSLPRWGMFGIGIASSIIEWLMLFVVLIYVFREKLLRDYLWCRLRSLDFTILKELFQIGTPMGFIYLFEAGLFSVAAIMMGWIGTTALAAYQILFQYLDVAFMFFLGVAQATALRIAYHMGAKQYATLRYTLSANISLGLFLALMIALIFYFYTPALINIFIKLKHIHNDELMLLARQYFSIASLFVFFDAIQVICNNGLRGMKDTFIPMWIGLGSYWLVGIGCAYGFAFVLKLNGSGLWWGLVVGIAASATILICRWLFMIQRYTHKTRPTS